MNSLEKVSWKEVGKYVCHIHQGDNGALKKENFGIYGVKSSIRKEDVM